MRIKRNALNPSACTTCDDSVAKFVEGDYQHLYRTISYHHLKKTYKWLKSRKHMG
jgi:hypothetical protein